MNAGVTMGYVHSELTTSASATLPGMHVDVSQVPVMALGRFRVPGDLPVEEPHAAIEGRAGGDIVNLVDRRGGARGADGALGSTPEAVVKDLTRLRMPAPRGAVARGGHRPVPARRTLAAVEEGGTEDFTELMLVPGVGARTLFALALVAEVIHGAPSRFANPGALFTDPRRERRPPVPRPLEGLRPNNRRAQACHRTRQAGRERAAGGHPPARRASAPTRKRGGGDSR